MKFWIVWCPQAEEPPRSKFSSESQARHAAVSMAKKHPDREFVVCEAMAVYTLPREPVAIELPKAVAIEKKEEAK